MELLLNSASDNRTERERCADPVNHCSAVEEAANGDASFQRTVSKAHFEAQTSQLAFEKYFGNTPAQEWPPAGLQDDSSEPDRVQQLVNDGIAHFRDHRLNATEQCWFEALALNEDCEEARDNLEVLKMVEKLKGGVH